MNQQPSRLLGYLPSIYADDPFLGNFLRIFEDTWEPLERQLDQLHTFFNPRLAPPEFLPWLGSWVDLVLDENWPISRRRELIRQAADLYRRRGTPGGLRDYLRIYVGIEPQIVEGDLRAYPHHFSVIFRMTATDQARIDEQRIRQIIDEEKPVHTVYTLIMEKIDG
jgi:phage tail-like protein